METDEDNAKPSSYSHHFFFAKLIGKGYTLQIVSCCLWLIVESIRCFLLEIAAVARHTHTLASRDGNLILLRMSRQHFHLILWIIENRLVNDEKRKAVSKFKRSDDYH